MEMRSLACSWRWIGLLFAVTGQVAAAMDESVFSRKLKVLPLGDSITQVRANTSYRYVLWKQFIDHGIDVDFLGTLDDTAFLTDPERPKTYRGRSYDGQHEGHWGWTADEVLEELDGWLDQYDTPDLALIHLGTNDAFRGQDHSDTYLEIANIIARLKKRNPSMLIVVAKIFPGFWGDVQPLNAEIARLDSPNVWIADCYTGIDLYEDSDDFAHPNASGGEKIAAAWWKVIERLLEPWRQTYDRWQLAHGKALPWQNDDDADGWINYFEYAGRTNPLVAQSRPVISWGMDAWELPLADPLRTRGQVILEAAPGPRQPFSENAATSPDSAFYRWKLKPANQGVFSP